MERTRAGSIGLVLVVAALSLMTSVAEAQERRAVVLDFDGRQSGAARRAVVRALSDELALERSEDFASRARSLGADLRSPTGIAQVANDVGVELVVRGEVTGSGRRMRTIVRVLDADGNEVARREAGSPRGRAGQRRIGQAAVEAVEQAKAELDRRDAEAAATQQTGGGFGGGGGLDQELFGDGEEEEEELEEPSGPPAPVPFLEAMVAFGLRTRDADINLASGGLRGYSAGLFPEIGLRIALRPLAGDEDLRGLFFEAEGYHSLGLSSVEERPDGTEVELGSSALRLLVAAGWLFGIGDGELGGGLGIGYDAFLLDDNQTMSSAQYTYLRPGIVFTYPLAEQLVGLRIDAGLRFGLGTGDLAPMFGTDASAFGFDLAAAIGGALESGIAYGLRLGYTGYSLGFEGTGTSNPDGSSNTAVDGSDGHFTVTLFAGYQLR